MRILSGEVRAYEVNQLKAEDMDAMDLRKLFARKLGFWSLHCAISAMPGFFCAIVISGEMVGKGNPADVVPMFAATITFAISLAAFFTWLESKGPMNVLVKKGLTLGLRIRIVMVVVGLLILEASNSESFDRIFLIPDVWIGLLAVFVNHWIQVALGNSAGIESMMNGAGGLRFGFIYALSLTVGIIIALMIFIISFVCSLFFQMHMRRGIVRREDLPGAKERIG